MRTVTRTPDEEISRALANEEGRALGRTEEVGAQYVSGVEYDEAVEGIFNNRPAEEAYVAFLDDAGYETRADFMHVKPELVSRLAEIMAEEIQTAGGADVRVIYPESEKDATDVFDKDSPFHFFAESILTGVDVGKSVEIKKAKIEVAEEVVVAEEAEPEELKVKKAELKELQVKKAKLKELKIKKPKVKKAEEVVEIPKKVPVAKKPVAKEVPAAEVAEKSPVAEKIVAQVAEIELFAIGSPVDVVKAVQGEPVSVIGNVWFYKAGVVVFDASGRVNDYTHYSGERLMVA